MSSEYWLCAGPPTLTPTVLQPHLHTASDLEVNTTKLLSRINGPKPSHFYAVASIGNAFAFTEALYPLVS